MPKVRLFACLCQPLSSPPWRTPAPLMCFGPLSPAAAHAVTAAPGAVPGAVPCLPPSQHTHTHDASLRPLLFPSIPFSPVAAHAVPAAQAAPHLERFLALRLASPPLNTHTMHLFAPFPSMPFPSLLPLHTQSRAAAPGALPGAVPVLHGGAAPHRGQHAQCKQRDLEHGGDDHQGEPCVLSALRVSTGV